MSMQPIAFGVRHVTPAIPEFLARYPQVRIELTLTDSFVDLVEAGADVAVRVGELEDSSLVARRLARNRRILCASPEYLTRAGAPEDPEDLAAHNCLIYTRHHGNVVWKLGGAQGPVEVRVDGNLRTNNTEGRTRGGRPRAGDRTAADVAGRTGGAVRPARRGARRLSRCVRRARHGDSRALSRPPSPVEQGPRLCRLPGGPVCPSPILGEAAARHRAKMTRHAPSRPTITTEQTFWCGNPPRLWVSPSTGSSSRWRSPARPSIWR